MFLITRGKARMRRDQPNRPKGVGGGSSTNRTNRGNLPSPATTHDVEAPGSPSTVTKRRRREEENEEALPSNNSTATGACSYVPRSPICQACFPLDVVGYDSSGEPVYESAFTADSAKLDAYMEKQDKYHKKLGMQTDLMIIVTSSPSSLRGTIMHNADA